MARQEINLGAQPTGVGGDTTRSTGVKINAMTQELYSRTDNLGTSAKANIGASVGNVADAQRLGLVTGIGGNDWYADEGPGFSSNLFLPYPSSPLGSGQYYKQTIKTVLGGSTDRTVIAWPYGYDSDSGTIKFHSIYRGVSTPVREIYHTGNTTRAADGTLKAI